MVTQDWPTFDGWAAARNVDPLTLPYPRFLNLAYYWGTKDTDANGRDRFDGALWIPPPGETPKGPWSAEAEAAALSSLAADTGQK